MPKIRIRDLDFHFDNTEDDSPTALSPQIVVSSDERKEFQDRLMSSTKADISAEARKISERLIESVDNPVTVINGVAVDNSTSARPEDFFTGEYLEDGSTQLTVSLLDLSSSVDFEGDIFYRALAVGRNTYQKDRGILLDSMFPAEMIGVTFSELKRKKRFPCISVEMVFNQDGKADLSRFKVFNSVVEIDRQLNFVEAKQRLYRIQNKERQQLTEEERHLKILNEIACTQTRYNQSTDRRPFGQISELKQLALGHLGSAMAQDKTPAIWLSTFHHRMLRFLPIICPNDLAVHRGFQRVTDEVVDSCREYLSWRNRIEKNKLAFALDRISSYDPTDFRTSFRADNPLRESLGLLNGYSVQRYIEDGSETEEGISPKISDLRRVVACRAAQMNERLTPFVR